MGDNNTENIHGRKIFFLYPTASVQNQIITELAQSEFEAYVSKDHNRLLRALKKYPDSVVFANIDEGMSPIEWERWVGAFHTTMPDIKIGIFTSGSDDELRTRYIEKHHVTCGFFLLKVDMSKVLKQVLNVLNVLDVKGRRKYLRATTDSEPTASLNLPFNSEYLNGDIKDISVVGFACAFEIDPGFKKNEIVRDIQIKLQSMLIKVEAVVFGSREENPHQNDGKRIYVMIFTQRVDPDIRVKIRKYIQSNLQAKMDAEIK